MAANFADSPEGLIRTTNLIAASSDYTAIWMATVVDPAAATFQSLYYIADNGPVPTQYIWLGMASTGTGRLLLDLNGALMSVGLTGGRRWIAYVRQGTAHRVYVDGVLLLSATLDVSAFTFNELYLGTDTAAVNWDPGTAAYFREWNTVLTPTQMDAEMHSASAVLAAFTDTPLATDLLDDSGNGHTWSQFGGVITFIGQPPTNAAPGGAIDVTSLPYSNVQNVHDAGTTFTVYYKRTAPVPFEMVGVLGYGDQVIYLPENNALQGPAYDLTTYNSYDAVNVPTQVDLYGGNTYHFSFAPNGGNPSPAMLEVIFVPGPVFATPPGTLVVPDDGLPLVSFLSLTTDDQVLRFLPFSAGEAGDILPNSGVMAMENFLASPDNTKVYDATFTEIATLAVNPVTGRGSIRAIPMLDKFFAINKTPNPDEVVAIESDGTISATYPITGVNDMEALTVGNDGDTLYYWRAGDNQKVRRWSLSGGVALTDLVDLGAGGSVPDILTLLDGTILVMFFNFLTNQTVNHYGTDGALLHTYSFGGQVGANFPSGSFWRIARANDDPDSFWLWSHFDVPNPYDLGGMSRFQNVRISDGAVLLTREFIEYESGIYQGDLTAYPFVRFGNSFSCPFWVLPEAEPPSSCPGLMGSPRIDGVTYSP